MTQTSLECCQSFVCLNSLSLKNLHHNILRGNLQLYFFKLKFAENFALQYKAAC